MMTQIDIPKQIKTTRSDEQDLTHSWLALQIKGKMCIFDLGRNVLLTTNQLVNSEPETYGGPWCVVPQAVGYMLIHSVA